MTLDIKSTRDDLQTLDYKTLFCRRSRLESTFAPKTHSSGCTQHYVFAGRNC